jgi:chromosome segregation ATPase
MSSGHDAAKTESNSSLQLPLSPTSELDDQRINQAEPAPRYSKRKRESEHPSSNDTARRGSVKLLRTASNDPEEQGFSNLVRRVVVGFISPAQEKTTSRIDGFEDDVRGLQTSRDDQRSTLEGHAERLQVLEKDSQARRNVDDETETRYNKQVTDHKELVNNILVHKDWLTKIATTVANMQTTDQGIERKFDQEVEGLKNVFLELKDFKEEMADAKSELAMRITKLGIKLEKEVIKHSKNMDQVESDLARVKADFIGDMANGKKKWDLERAQHDERLEKLVRSCEDTQKRVKDLERSRKEDASKIATLERSGQEDTIKIAALSQALAAVKADAGNDNIQLREDMEDRFTTAMTGIEEVSRKCEDWDKSALVKLREETAKAQSSQIEQLNTQSRRIDLIEEARNKRRENLDTRFDILEASDKAQTTLLKTHTNQIDTIGRTTREQQNAVDSRLETLEAHDKMQASQIETQSSRTNTVERKVKEHQDGLESRVETLEAHDRSATIHRTILDRALEHMTPMQASIATLQSHQAKLSTALEPLVTKEHVAAIEATITTLQTQQAKLITALKPLATKAEVAAMETHMLNTTNVLVQNACNALSRCMDQTCFDRTEGTKTLINDITTGEVLFQCLVRRDTPPRPQEAPAKNRASFSAAPPWQGFRQPAPQPLQIQAPHVTAVHAGQHPSPQETMQTGSPRSAPRQSPQVPAQPAPHHSPPVTGPGALDRAAH